MVLSSLFATSTLQTQDLSDLEAEFERQLTEQRALEEKIDQRRQHAGILTQVMCRRAIMRVFFIAFPLQNWCGKC